LLLLTFGKSTVRGIGDSQVATNRFILNRENRAMNQPVLLHIVERLEGFLGKLPASIQRPILNDLTPLKELFLQQRSPRFLLAGSNKVPVADLAATIFRPPETEEMMTAALSLFRWQQITFEKHGTILWLDARGADDAALSQIHEELKSQPADIFFYLHSNNDSSRATRRELDTLAILLQANDAAGTAARVIALHLVEPVRFSSGDAKSRSAKISSTASWSDFQEKLNQLGGMQNRLLRTINLSFPFLHPASELTVAEIQSLLRLLARELPNAARVEMVRLSHDREAQMQVAQVLVKSTTAICTAIGAQPIPLADLPVLTTLQLVMVSGIMYISGRERSMRAATEFIAALGANVGAGMILREGARAVLKFFPGWGNVVCGMVAGAGTYAVGRAASVYFLEGASLQDARRTFRRSRDKRNIPLPPLPTRRARLRPERLR
jgi:uncharacterized protein (DUF697 family)